MLHICVDFRWFGAVDEPSGRSGPDHDKPLDQEVEQELQDPKRPLDPQVEHRTSPLHFTTRLEVECPHLHHQTITWSLHSTMRSSVFTFTARPLLDHITLPRGRVPPSHHSTAYSMTSFRAFFIPHSTRHSSTRKKRRLQLFTRPLTRPPGSSTVLNPSKYFVVLSIRVSGYLAISSMYFLFSQKRSFYLVLFPQTLCSRLFVIRISLYLFSIQLWFLIFVYCCSFCYHTTVTLLLSCLQPVQRLCFLLWCLSSE